jgi:cyclase
MRARTFVLGLATVVVSLSVAAASPPSSPVTTSSAPASSSSSSSSSKPLFVADGWSVQAVAPGVWAAVAVPVEEGGPLCNAGIVDTGKATIVVDTGASPHHGKAIAAIAQRLTGRSPAIVVNTHHHDDHTSGNEGLPVGVVVVAARPVKAAMIAEWPADLAKDAARAKERLAGAQQARAEAHARNDAWGEQEAFLWATAFAIQANVERVSPRTPDVLVDAPLSFDGPLHTVDVLPLAPAHTSGDVLVVVKDAGVVFSGDVVFVGMHPFVPDGDVAGWKAALGRVRALAPRVIVPGHGAVAGVTAVDDMEAWFKALEDAVAAAKAQKKNPDDIAVPASFAHWHLRRFFSIDAGYLSSTTKP